MSLKLQYVPLMVEAGFIYLLVDFSRPTTTKDHQQLVLLHFHLRPPGGLKVTITEKRIRDVRLSAAPPVVPSGRILVGTPPVQQDPPTFQTHGQQVAGREREGGRDRESMFCCIEKTFIHFPYPLLHVLKNYFECFHYFLSIYLFQ